MSTVGGHPVRPLPPRITDPRPEVVDAAVERYWSRRPRHERWAKRLRDAREAVRRVLVVEWRRRFR